MITSHKPIRSFVLRQGRMSLEQKKKIEASNIMFDAFASPFSMPLFSINNNQNFSHLEIGFGMGDQLIHRCQYYPDQKFLGIEVHLPGIASCLKKFDDLKLSNLCILRTDVMRFFENSNVINYFESIWILFPDPWPKKNQKKRRLINDNTLKKLINCLKPQGQLFIKTDCADYAQCIEEVLQKNNEIESLSKNHLLHKQACIQTKYEKKAQKAFSQIYSFLVRKI